MVNWWESKEYERKLNKLTEESERLKEERLKKERRALKDEELEKIKQKKLRQLMEKAAETKRTKSAPNKPVDLTDATFTEAVQNHPVVVVDCWAPWCHPCLYVSPIVEEMALDYAGKIFFGKLNVDGNKKVAMKYGIMSIPTLLVFKNGKLVDQIMGARPREKLEPMITRYIE
jgi:thioredoxin 1